MSGVATGGPLATGWLNTVADAVKILSRHRLEGLLILADSNSVVVEGGVVIDGRLSEALLVAILIPEGLNPLHRGAVLIRAGRVERAAVPILRAAGWDWVGHLAREVSGVVVSVSEDDSLVRVSGPGGEVTTVGPDALALHVAACLAAEGRAQ